MEKSGEFVLPFPEDSSNLKFLSVFASAFRVSLPVRQAGAVVPQGTKADEAKAGIKQDVEWENELFELPNYYSHIDKIVNYVFSS